MVFRTISKHKKWKETQFIITSKHVLLSYLSVCSLITKIDELSKIEEGQVKHLLLSIVCQLRAQ